MSIIVTNNHQKLTIQLTTPTAYSSHASPMIQIHLKNKSPQTYYSTTYTQNPDGTITHTFILPFKNFNIGDEITNIKFKNNLPLKLSELNEGLAILVDGKETQTIHSTDFTAKFTNTKPHTIQAAYKGNDEIGVAFSNKIYIKAEDAVQMGKYTLTSNIPKTFKYMDTPDWTWTLKLNGTPVPNKTIERVLPTTTYSGDTNSKGQIHQGLPKLNVLAKWIPATYTIIANFYHYNDPQDLENKTLIQCKNKLTIVKNTPTLTFTPSAGKGKKMKFKLKDPQGQAMPNQKIDLKINGKGYLRTTNSDGVVKFKTNVKGRYKGAATFIGNKYYNYKTVKFDQVIRWFWWFMLLLNGIMI